MFKFYFEIGALIVIYATSAKTLLFNCAFAIDYCTLCENGTHSMCQFKEGPTESCINYTKLSLTPDEKMYILDIHNDIRNHVASGQESRGALGNQPAAADMFLLEWDEELEMIAQRWVDQCVSVNATALYDKCRRTENFEVGQNVVTAIASNVQLPELSVLILNWYKQIMYVIPSDVDEFTGIWRSKYQIGQYTQLVWAKTRFVGCAAAAFKETAGDPLYNIRFVCNYGPAGNIIGQAVYQRGKPCSGCPHRVCDMVRPNLCAGIDKTVNIKKQNPIFKKYNDKATTLSNMIDIEDPKINTRILNFNILNKPKTLNTPVELEKDFENSTVTNIINISLTNFTEMVENTYSIISSIVTTHEDNDTSIFTASTIEETSNSSLITENEDYSLISGPSQTLTNPIEWINLTDFNLTTSVYFDNKTNYFINKSTTPSIYGDLNGLLNTTLSTKWGEDYKKSLKLKITFLTSIELFMGNFFNQSIPEATTKKPEPENDLIIDLTKNKCEKTVKLNNGIILVQDCESDLRKSINPGQKFVNQLRAKRKRILVKGNEIVLPGNRHFKRATGVWRHGHCRCARFLRSCSTNLDVTLSLFLLIAFALFLTIEQ